MTQEEINLMVELYKKGLSAAAIGKYVPYTPHTVLKYVQASGVPIRSRAGFKKPFNESYFHEIDTEKKSYLLGFLMADGNVQTRINSQPAIRLEIGRKDRIIVETLKSELATDREVHNSRKDCCRLVVHSQKLFDDLAMYGVAPSKTGHEIFPRNKIPENLIHHFLRGFIDGDGWLTRTKHGHGKPCLNLGMCGNVHMLSDIRDYFCETLDCYHLKISSARGYDGFGNLIYSSRKDVKAICEYLYDDATIYLQRKKEKYDSFFNADAERVSIKKSA